MTHDLGFPEYRAHLLDFIAWQSEAQAGENMSPPPDQKVQASAAQFNELALALFALQFGSVPPYRRFCEARRMTPRSVRVWADIPPIPTSAFKELELSSLPVNDRTSVFYSSGTTTHKPSRHFHSSESLGVYESSILPWFRLHALSGFGGAVQEAGVARSPQVQFIILTPSPALAPHSSLARMFETVRRAYGSASSIFTGKTEVDGAWTLDLEKTVSALHEAVRKGRPVVLLGTAFSLVHLLDFLRETGCPVHLPAGSRALETGGYKGRSRALPQSELHAMMTGLLDIPATHMICEYGMSELSSQAYDRIAGSGESPSSHLRSPINRRFRFPPWARAQVVSPETGREVSEGETGLIRVFDLANVYSVLAIQTEDLGLRRGTGFELIGRAAPAEPRGCSLLAVDS